MCAVSVLNNGGDKNQLSKHCKQITFMPSFKLLALFLMNFLNRETENAMTNVICQNLQQATGASSFSEA